MQKKAFVAATTSDLSGHRAYVIDKLRKSGIHVDPMEEWSAGGSLSPSDFCRQQVSGCDLLVLLVAWKRG